MTISVVLDKMRSHCIKMELESCSFSFFGIDVLQITHNTCQQTDKDKMKLLALFYNFGHSSTPDNTYSTTCLVSTLKGTPNMYFLSEIPGVCTAQEGQGCVLTRSMY